MNPTQVVDYADALLSRRFPKRVVKFGPVSIPAYEWPGAGSEKGGSSGHLEFNKMIFCQNQEDEDSSIAISVGREDGRRDTSSLIIRKEDDTLAIPYVPTMYGVFRALVSDKFVKRVLEIYEENREEYDENREEDFSFGGEGYGKAKKRNLNLAFVEFIKRNNYNYTGISLFAFNQKIRGLRDLGFFVKKSILIKGENLKGVLEPLEDYNDLIRHIDGRDKEIKLANSLANKLLIPHNFVLSDELPDLNFPFDEENMEEPIHFRGNRERKILRDTLERMERG